VADLPSELMRHWTHSREEDTDDMRVYRPDDWDFPPARGRRGFELRPGGELLVYGPGATDRPEATTGRWESSGEGRVRVGDDELEIVSLEPDRLTVRPSGG
jgi:hypothetical protein